MSMLCRLSPSAYNAFRAGKAKALRAEFMSRARRHDAGTEARCQCVQWAREYHRIFMAAMREAAS